MLALRLVIKPPRKAARSGGFDILEHMPCDVRLTRYRNLPDNLGAKDLKGIDEPVRAPTI